jgi:FADH2-dependent halogenase
MSEVNDRYTAIVIGGGPAGSSAAAVLARKGYSVLLLERLVFPRFHIGESLLPYMTGLLDRMGMLEKIEQSGFVTKRGAEFTRVDGTFRRVNFTALGEGRKQYAYEVERAGFDDLLLRQAVEAGVQLLEGAHVVRPLLAGDAVIGVEFEYKGGTQKVYADFVIDASGRAGRLANFFKLRKVDRRLRQVAVFKHFTDVKEENNPGTKGDIQIGGHEKGWVWAIPIREGTLSIGTVTSRDYVKQASSLEEIFEQQHARIPRIAQRIYDATPLREAQAETDFSYHADRLAGPGFLLVGDAGCFADPIFSGGVYLAITTGIKAAETVDAIMGEKSAAEQALHQYENFYKTGYDCYFRLIYAFYEANYDFANYVATTPREVTQKEKWITRMIAGDFWSSHNPLTQFLRSDRRWATFEPFELSYGCPIYPELDAVAM